MIGLLIGKEIRAHLLSYRFVLTFVLLFVLVVSSVQVIALSYDRQLANYVEGQRAQEERLRESTDFRSLRWQGIKVERRPNPLSVFAMGLEKEMARSVSVSQLQEAKLGHSKYANPLFVLFPAPDLLYIVNIVGSLLAVLLAFDAVCGEQEEGTLRLTMANSVPRHAVLLAKWVGGYAVLIVSFLFSVITAVLFAQLTTSLRLSGSEWMILLGLVGIAALYMSVFYALSLMISTLVHRSSTSLVVNFLVWVLLVLLVPNTAPIVARAVAPIPSAGVVAGQRESIQRSVMSSVREQMRGTRDNEQRSALFDAAQTRIRAETDKVVADYLQKVDSQIALGISLARLSPSASYVFAAAGLAGSGLSDFAGLREYIKRYRRTFVDKLEEIETSRRQQAESAADASERQEIMEAPIEPSDLPAFTPARAPIGELLVAANVDIMLLLVLNVVFFLGAYMGFLRYDLMK